MRRSGQTQRANWLVLMANRVRETMEEVNRQLQGGRWQKATTGTRCLATSAPVFSHRGTHLRISHERRECTAQADGLVAQS